MLNKIFFWLLCIGIVYGFAKSAYKSIHPPANAAEKAATADAGKPSAAATDSSAKKDVPNMSEFAAAGKRLNDAVFEAAETSIKICIGLIGVMALWLGLLNVAKDSGAIEAVARFMSPVFRWLFPEVPKGHPAQGAMLMSFAANMLGLDNAATPLSIKAMEELQTLNPVKDTVTNSQALFMAINCGSITLIPFSVIALRSIEGSNNPSSIIVGTWIASSASVVAAITVARLLARSPRFAVAPTQQATSIDAGGPLDAGKND